MTEGFVQMLLVRTDWGTEAAVRKAPPLAHFCTLGQDHTWLTCSGTTRQQVCAERMASDCCGLPVAGALRTLAPLYQPERSIPDRHV